jgi:hypothetical protein
MTNISPDGAWAAFRVKGIFFFSCGTGSSEDREMPTKNAMARSRSMLTLYAACG